jgi:hypothetical protein
MSRKYKNKRRLTTPPPQSAASMGVPWYKKTWFRIAAVTSIVSWLLLNGPTAIDNLQILPSKIQSAYSTARDWYYTDSTWTGKWINEGEIDARYQPDVYVGLDVLVYDSSVSGSITSSQFPKNFPLDSMLIRGEKVSANKIRFDVFDYIGGLPIDFAKLEAEIVVTTDGVPIIHIKPLWQAMAIFPLHAELWKATDPEMVNSSKNLQPTTTQSTPQPRRNVLELRYSGRQ